MNTSGIFITTEHLKSMTKQDQDFLFGILSARESVPEPSGPGPAVQDSTADDEHFAELSPGQAREFYTGCGPKTKKAIEVIADSSSHRFHLADIAKALGEKPTKLRGVWGGLTRRLTTVTGDSQAYLIDWSRSELVMDDNGNCVDHIGEVTELTYRSFRKVLGRS